MNIRNKNSDLGEYDPPYDFNNNPTDEQIKKAKEIIEKYEKLAAERKKNNRINK